ncbi:hypothetical protein DT019_05065 [Streptomyces sp. SDr-06]|uniref:hypothetical protein n=1 Tax=Streptomyces sp. SDr-06 TaxID=2267702 RepID=UPI000DE8E09C|nr:hypothetical protein [Streptomyces sp. SDr-06]RCH69289.1 hypothetical protein DT019_05065 [Streptomyces sp. SDr-06]
MRTARLLTSALLASAAVLGPAGSLAYAENAPGGSLELWPSSASPGTTVTANTTACGSAARGTGDANAVGAGDFQMSVSTHKEVLAGQFQVAPRAQPGTFRISVSCENGKVVEAQLTVTAGSDRDRHTHDKSSEWNDQRGKDKAPEWNDPRGKDKAPEWNDQHAKDKSWDWGGQGHDKSWETNDPRGHVKTGVGGSVGPDTTEIAVGAAVLAAAAVGGTWLLRRRASGAQGRG